MSECRGTNCGPRRLFGGFSTPPAEYSDGVRIFTNLNLNGSAPTRVQPKVGEWGPQMVPTTAAKKRMRIWASLALLVAVAALFGLGYYFYKALTGG